MQPLVTNHSFDYMSKKKKVVKEYNCFGESISGIVEVRLSGEEMLASQALELEIAKPIISIGESKAIESFRLSKDSLGFDFVSLAYRGWRNYESLILRRGKWFRFDHVSEGEYSEVSIDVPLLISTIKKYEDRILNWKKVKAVLDKLS